MLTTHQTSFQLLIICKPRYRELVRDIVLQASKYIIKQSEQVKILGVYYTSGLDNTPNVNKIIQKVNFRILTLNKIIRYTNTKTSLILYNSLVISIFNYCLENLMNINKRQLNTLNVLLNKCSHQILGITSYRLTTTNILKKLDWLTFPQMFSYQALKLIHRISFKNNPPALCQYLYHSMTRSDLDRLVRKPSPKDQYKSAKLKNIFIHRTIYMYNDLPDDIRAMPKKQI